MWTDRQIRAFTAKSERYAVVDSTGQRGAGRLMLDIQPAGTKVFYFQYYIGSKRKRIKIGSYGRGPKYIGLAEARDKAYEYSKTMQKGSDPKFVREQLIAEKRRRERELEVAKRQATFGQLMDDYLDNLDATGKRSRKSIERSLKRYVRDPFPELIKALARDVETEDITEILRRMIQKGITTHSNRVRSYLHAAFQYGLAQDNNPRHSGRAKYVLKFNPVSGVPKQNDFERQGEHVIRPQEIKVIWETIEGEAGLILGSLCKLAFLTGQRPGELIRTPWASYAMDDGLMEIPHFVSKNSRAHAVPLGEIAIDVLEPLQELTGDYKYPFTSRRGRKFYPDKHIHGTSFSKAISDYCEAKTEIERFIPRDIRRTVKTLMGKAGVSKELRDRIQNHALHDVSSKHYDKYDYLEEKRHGLKIWNDYLALIISPEEKIVRLRTNAK